jgi:hypothetical protein
MSLQFAHDRRAFTGGEARRMIWRFAWATVGAGFAAISINVMGADLETGYSRTVGAPSYSAPASHRPIPAHPTDPPDIKPGRRVEHTPVVDELYNELMRWTPAGCSSQVKEPSLTGGC